MNNEQDLTIYHNPSCSKSREALDILQNKGLKFKIIDYLKTPLSLDQLTKLRSYFKLADFVRTNEKRFKDLGLSLEKEDELLQVMLQEPILMQRPIVTFKNKAIIGRPPEKILALFE
ncbi:oxidoreductase [Legionella beliardensis]|uniref:Arsenate reductase n=1 Tax=Legionella beliardensis TaxID=91822 RepID=A0A378I3U3_9GAMM|nr:arsenate reductase (glutaredoxin) [Legionella beliardensis]STX29371.1 oxidoreductase [Legionella beliardensis]